MSTVLNDGKIAPSSADLLGNDAGRGEILAVIERFWAAMDARDDDEAETLIGSDPVFIDTFAPHIWAGPGAFKAWLGDLWAFCAREEMVVASTAIREPSRCQITAASAYVVSPAVMASARKGDLVSQHGTMTVVLKLENNAWRITGMCWAGQ